MFKIEVGSYILRSNRAKQIQTGRQENEENDAGLYKKKIGMTIKKKFEGKKKLTDIKKESTQPERKLIIPMISKINSSSSLKKISKARERGSNSSRKKCGLAFGFI